MTSEDYPEKLRELKKKCDAAWCAWYDSWKKDKDGPYTKELRSNWGSLVDTYHEDLAAFAKTLPSIRMYS
ncbi:hypothetical protein [Synechococcus phage MA01]